jgi:hypothetical protein
VDNKNGVRMTNAQVDTGRTVPIRQGYKAISLIIEPFKARYPFSCDRLNRSGILVIKAVPSATPAHIR